MRESFPHHIFIHLLSTGVRILETVGRDCKLASVEAGDAHVIGSLELPSEARSKWSRKFIGHEDSVGVEDGIQWGTSQTTDPSYKP